METEFSDLKKKVINYKFFENIFLNFTKKHLE